MAPNFTAGQNPLYPQIIVLTDTSTSVTGTITGRRVYIENNSGQYLTPTGTTTDYIAWALADASISINCLTESTACSVRVDWVDSGGAVVETLTQIFCFDLFSRQFAYSLIQGLVPPITLNTNYSSNLAALWAAIMGAENATTLNNDIATSQNALNQAIYLQTNANLFF